MLLSKFESDLLVLCNLGEDTGLLVMFDSLVEGDAGSTGS